MSNHETSVVICTKNASATIAECINSVIALEPLEIIVVDGNSTDKTTVIAEKLGAKVTLDGGRGIAYARHLGVANAAGKFILFVGPDNILPTNFIRNMLNEMEFFDYHAAAPQTRVRNPLTYWDKGLDFRLLCMENQPGEREVIGTPTLYRAEVFNRVQYNEKAGACDDTDIGLQLKRNGFRLGVVPVTVCDLNGLSARDIWIKFKLYGSGDADFYSLNSAQWSFFRCIKSLSHPFRQLLVLGVKAVQSKKVSLIFWLLIATLARYFGWVTKAITR